MSEWVKKQAPTSYLPKPHFTYKLTYRLESKKMKIYYAKTNQKKVVGDILISHRADFKARKGIRDKEGHYIKKGSIVNVYMPNSVASKCVRQKKWRSCKKKIDESSTIVRDFNIPSPPKRNEQTQEAENQ